MKLHSGVVAVAGALAVAMTSPRASGQVLNELDKVLASDGVADDLFGWSISVSGDVAVVGARTGDGNFANSGAAYVFRQDGAMWVEEQKLTASDGLSGDLFGSSISVSGNVVVVGALGVDDNGGTSGAAYVYRWNGAAWVEEQKLTASDGAAQDTFGESISVSGDVVVTGATGDDDNGSASGSVYVFRWNGSSWTEEQKLLASDGAAVDNFGHSVSVSGDVAVVGAIFDDANGSTSGSAYVFRWNPGAPGSWVEEQKLLASDGAVGDFFGFSVSASGDVVAVGAVFEDDNGNDAGSAYMFRWNPGAPGSWVEEQKLTASDGAASDFFGVSVSVSDAVAVVGADFADDLASDVGAAYAFHWNGSSWVQVQKLLASDGGTADEFGLAVSVSGGVVAVGAMRDDDNGIDSGSAYVFNVGVPEDIPTVSEWGLVAMTLLLMCAGTTVLRQQLPMKNA